MPHGNPFPDRGFAERTGENPIGHASCTDSTPPVFFDGVLCARRCLRKHSELNDVAPSNHEFSTGAPFPRVLVNNAASEYEPNDEAASECKFSTGAPSQHEYDFINSETHEPVIIYTDSDLPPTPSSQPTIPSRPARVSTASKCHAERS
ncbi:hypothetical protein PaG_01795 [Moesziomyces aphidis]|uniref:Uncharacterized protein n=1 Tax=Moesziomyces aphidis TaxID=84754 RepID=W3VPM2_MOEAP|nr:hypothetical protein PaG_01795 [Moesziomyces aphidis]